MQADNPNFFIPHPTQQNLKKYFFRSEKNSFIKSEQNLKESVFLIYLDLESILKTFL